MGFKVIFPLIHHLCSFRFGRNLLKRVYFTDHIPRWPHKIPDWLQLPQIDTVLLIPANVKGLTSGPYGEYQNIPYLFGYEMFQESFYYRGFTSLFWDITLSLMTNIISSVVTCSMMTRSKRSRCIHGKFLNYVNVFRINVQNNSLIIFRRHRK